MKSAYPLFPGFTETTTSKAAAESVAPLVGTIKERVLLALGVSPMTADEVAKHIKEDVLSTRPRLTELKALGKIVETGRHRKNKSGKLAHVWRLKNKEETPCASAP